ncbi:hypothetical protein J6590_010303 [Homalodisca vitripennis]|nr:hypothetical protein J6590_010303 [Homalodisca vitripennis]
MVLNGREGRGNDEDVPGHASGGFPGEEWPRSRDRPGDTVHCTTLVLALSIRAVGQLPIIPFPLFLVRLEVVSVGLFFCIPQRVSENTADVLHPGIRFKIWKSQQDHLDLQESKGQCLAC